MRNGPAVAERVRERRIEPLGRDRDLAPQEPQLPVAKQRPGHEPGLGQDLEPVADAEHEAAVGREFGDRAHDRAEARDDAGPQVVPVREPAGQDDRGDAPERGLLVPQLDRFGTG